MGNPGKPSSTPSIQHFIHEHQLHLLNIKAHPTLNLVPCAGCKLKPSEWVYACKPCNFILHISCSQMPKVIHHSLDPNHPFTLLAQTTYPDGEFSCDACGEKSDGFCYNCSICGLDLHILCAKSQPSAPTSTQRESRSLVQPLPQDPNQASFPPTIGIDAAPLLGQNYLQSVFGNIGDSSLQQKLLEQQQLRDNFIQSVMGNTAVATQQQQVANFLQSVNNGSFMAAQQQLQDNLVQTMLRGSSVGATPQLAPNFMQSFNGGGTGLSQQVGQTVVQNVMGGNNAGVVADASISILTNLMGLL